MPMKLKRIDHIGVVIDGSDDLARLLEDALGLRLGRQIDVGDVAARFYPCGDASVEVIEVRDDEARRERLGGAARARIEHIAIEVDDLEETVAELGRLGVELTGPPREAAGSASVWTRPETSAGIQLQFTQHTAA